VSNCSCPAVLPCGVHCGRRRYQPNEPTSSLMGPRRARSRGIDSLPRTLPEVSPTGETNASLGPVRAAHLTQPARDLRQANCCAAGREKLPSPCSPSSEQPPNIPTHVCLQC
jgi:hypothetical protein